VFLPFKNNKLFENKMNFFKKSLSILKVMPYATGQINGDKKLSVGFFSLNYKEKTIGNIIL
jgi:hypothetical protein